MFEYYTTMTVDEYEEQFNDTILIADEYFVQKGELEQQLEKLDTTSTDYLTQKKIIENKLFNIKLLFGLIVEYQNTDTLIESYIELDVSERTETQLTILDKPENMTAHTTTNITVQLTDNEGNKLQNKNILLYSKGERIDTQLTDNEGKVILTYTPSTSDETKEEELLITFFGTSEYNNTSMDTTITITPIPTILTQITDSTDVYVLFTSQIQVKLTTDTGTPIQDEEIQITNSEDITTTIKTDTHGIGIYEFIPSKTTATTFTATHTLNNGYDQSTATLTVTPNKQPTKITINPITITKGENSEIIGTITAIDKEGNEYTLPQDVKIGVKIGGKTQNIITYSEDGTPTESTTTTISQGIINILVNTTTLSINTYSLTVKFGGTTYYAATESEAVTLKVVKEKDNRQTITWDETTDNWVGLFNNPTVDQIGSKTALKLYAMTSKGNLTQWQGCPLDCSKDWKLTFQVYTYNLNYFEFSLREELPIKDTWDDYPAWSMEFQTEQKRIWEINDDTDTIHVLPVKSNGSTLASINTSTWIDVEFTCISGIISITFPNYSNKEADTTVDGTYDFSGHVLYLTAHYWSSTGAAGFTGLTFTPIKEED